MENTLETNVQSPKIKDPIELLKNAWSLYKTRFNSLLPISLLVFIATLLQMSVSIHAHFLMSLAMLLSFVVTYLSSLAYFFVFFDNNAAQENYLTFYQKAWIIIVPYTIVSIIVFFMAAAAAVFLLIPAIIVGIYVTFAVYAVVFENFRGFAAITKSIAYVQGNWWKIFWRIIVLALATGLSFALINAILTFSFGMPVAQSVPGEIISQAFDVFILTPFGFAYSYLLYKSVKEKNDRAITEVEVMNVRSKSLLLMALGVLVAVIISIAFGPKIVNFIKNNSNNSSFPDGNIFS